MTGRAAGDDGEAIPADAGAPEPGTADEPATETGEPTGPIGIVS